MGSTEIVLTDEAQDLIDRIKSRRSGDFTLVLGNGCCDSTAPYLFADYLAGPNERPFGEVGGVAVVIDELVAAAFDGAEVVIDVAKDPQADSFSCEAELGYRFTIDRLPAA